MHPLPPYQKGIGYQNIVGGEIYSLGTSALTTQPIDSCTEYGRKVICLLIHIPDDSEDKANFS